MSRRSRFRPAVAIEAPNRARWPTGDASDVATPTEPKLLRVLQEQEFERSAAIAPARGRSRRRRHQHRSFERVAERTFAVTSFIV